MKWDEVCKSNGIISYQNQSGFVQDQREWKKHLLMESN